MSKIVNISIVFIFFALSFLVLENLPNYIADNAEYSVLIYILWTLGFSVAFIKTGLG